MKVSEAIESINYQLRKVSKTRGQFPSDDAVYKILYLAVCDIETREIRGCRSYGAPRMRRECRRSAGSRVSATPWS